MGIALLPMPVFRRDSESMTQPERKEEGKMEGRKRILKRRNTEGK